MSEINDADLQNFKVAMKAEFANQRAQLPELLNTCRRFLAAGQGGVMAHLLSRMIREEEDDLTPEVAFAVLKVFRDDLPMDWVEPLLEALEAATEDSNSLAKEDLMWTDGDAAAHITALRYIFSVVPPFHPLRARGLTLLEAMAVDPQRPPEFRDSAEVHAAWTVAQMVLTRT